MVYSGETLQVTEAVNLIGGVLEEVLPAVMVEGEVSSFKVSKGKWVFFDLKDDSSTINCFMPVFKLGIPLKDGMKVRLVGVPRLTSWGKFSLTTQAIQPIGKGSIGEAHKLLKQKLEKEGLFDEQRKRGLPAILQEIVVISSSGAAGWGDFQKIINERWQGITIKFIDVQVQGLASPAQAVKAIDFANQNLLSAEAIVIIRGGGAIEDLAGFNDEALVRSVGSSKIPVVVGVGHESDETLASLAADISASTPTHAASLITPDKREFQTAIDRDMGRLNQYMLDTVDDMRGLVSNYQETMKLYFENFNTDAQNLIKLLGAYNPADILTRGYALLRSQDGSLISHSQVPKKGDNVTIETANNIISTEVNNVQKK